MNKDKKFQSIKNNRNIIELNLIYNALHVIFFRNLQREKFFANSA